MTKLEMVCVLFAGTAIEAELATVAVCAVLGEGGWDEYEPIYAGKWQLVGVRANTTEAARKLLALVAEVESGAIFARPEVIDALAEHEEGR